MHVLHPLVDVCWCSDAGHIHRKRFSATYLGAEMVLHKQVGCGQAAYVAQPETLLQDHATPCLAYATHDSVIALLSACIAHCTIF